VRVTQRMLSNNLLYSYEKNLSGISKTQEQISLGTKINRPSDDPSGCSLTMALMSNLNLNGQYQRNITNGLGWLQQTDVGLEKATDAMQKVRELVVQGANDTLTQDDRVAIAEQVDTMTDAMVEVANTSLGGIYIFAGLDNTSEPFHRSGDDFTFTGDDSEVLREIAPGARYQVNINGKHFFYDNLVEVAKGSGSTVDQVTIDDGLQFGEYKISTTVEDAASAGDSEAQVTSYYTQEGNTIVANVGVVNAGNVYNSSILMEVTGINYTSEYKISDVTVQFTYHQYNKSDGSYTTGTVSQTFTDSDGDGDPDTPASFTVGDIDLNMDLTEFIVRGDKAVISVTAQSAIGDNNIGIDYDGTDRNWVFSNTVADPGNDLKFFTLDEGNGESYDGTVDITFNGGFATASEAATFTAGNIFDCLVYVRKKLENNQTDKIEQCLSYLDEKIGWLLQERVRVGARTTHLEAIDEQYTNLEVNLSDMMDGYYSTDVAKATVELNEKTLIYQASLAAGARIMQTSLLDYLD